MSADNESSMLHACNAVDGTARKCFPSLGNRARFTRFLRENYDVLGPMALPHFNLASQFFPVSSVKPTPPAPYPDIADIVYGVHRCCHSHGDELPNGFELMLDAFGPQQETRIQVERGKVRLSDRTIFGLLACVVLAPVNNQLNSAGDVYLTYNGTMQFPVNDWWGRKVDFLREIAEVPLQSVNIEFSNWLNGSN